MEMCKHLAWAYGFNNLTGKTRVCLNCYLRQYWGAFGWTNVL